MLCETKFTRNWRTRHIKISSLCYDTQYPSVWYYVFEFFNTLRKEKRFWRPKKLDQSVIFILRQMWIIIQKVRDSHWFNSLWSVFSLCYAKIQICEYTEKVIKGWYYNCDPKMFPYENIRCWSLKKMEIISNFRNYLDVLVIFGKQWRLIWVIIFKKKIRTEWQKLTSELFVQFGIQTTQQINKQVKEYVRC